jgi:hypothetical protein
VVRRTDRRSVLRTERVRGLVRLHQPKGEPSVEGLLLGIVEDHYRLLNAKLLVDSNREHDVQIDGETFVPLRRVLYVQKVG